MAVIFSPYSIVTILFFTELTIARKQVLMDMAYQLGVKGLFNFTDMLSALYTADFDSPADEMLDSKWHRDLVKYAKGKEQTTRSYKASQTMRIGF